MLDVVYIPVFALHLLAVNVASAAPLVCCWLRWRETRHEDAAAGAVGRYLARQSSWMLLWGSALGMVLVGLLWLGPDHRYFDLIRQHDEFLRPKLWWGLAELVFSLGCMWAYAVTWDRLGGGGRLKRGIHHLLAVLAATNLIYHFPPLFAVMSALSVNPSLLDGAMLDRKVFLRLMGSSEVIWMVVHVLLASVATTGVMMMGFALRMARQADDTTEAETVAIWGGRIALLPSIAQLLAGVYVLFHLPGDMQKQFMGGDMPTTLLFGLSVVAALALMHSLAAVALGDVQRKTIIRSMALLVLTVLLMSAALHVAKMRTSGPVGSASPPTADVMKFDARVVAERRRTVRRGPGRSVRCSTARGCRQRSSEARRLG